MVATTTCADGISTATAVSQEFTVNVVDFDNIPAGAGRITGRTCFDIAQNTCRGLTAARRVSQRTNFALRDVQTLNSLPPFSGVQTYTFTASGNFISNVRYIIHDPDGTINQSLTPLSGVLVEGSMANNASENLIIHFRSDLNTTLIPNRDHGNDARVTINIIFFDSSIAPAGADRHVSLNLRIRDCICCGAYVAEGDWRMFMCHNLGADENINPFVGHQDLHGHMFKWSIAMPALTADWNIAHIGSTFPDGIIWNNRGGIPIGTQTIWDMTTHPPNPCPPGWRVPTRNEWAGVIDTTLNPRRNMGAVVWQANSFITGAFFGNYLFLPAAGIRDSWNSGVLASRGQTAAFWTSQRNQMAVGSADHLWISWNHTSIGTAAPMQHGLSVRCIAAD